MTQLDLQQRLERAEAQNKELSAAVVRIAEQRDEQERIAISNFENCSKLEAERDALQQQVNALAAENAVMLKLLTDISENHVEYFSEGESGMFAGVPLDYVSEINMYVSRDVNAENPFPSTDAYLNSVRAEGAHQVAVAIKACEDEFPQASLDIVQECALIADNTAAQLRAGEQGGDHA